jgi:hypothetical protein
MAVVVAVLYAMLAMGAAQAAEKGRSVVKADTRDAFEATAANVRKEMLADGRYAYVSVDERSKVETGLEAMSALFAASGTVDQMDKASRVKLFNAQEEVNSILSLRDRDRLVCERGAPTGSRIVSTNCRTYGDLEAARQASAKFMTEKSASPCNSPACAGK